MTADSRCHNSALRLGSIGSLVFSFFSQLAKFHKLGISLLTPVVGVFMAGIKEWRSKGYLFVQGRFDGME